ncbi:MAG TPA: DUF6515 family protein [Steroidobacteraceae bacterium]|nr:DUF6515 family protein [Steroidobacteraceae bacterium]
MNKSMKTLRAVAVGLATLALGGAMTLASAQDRHDHDRGGFQRGRDFRGDREVRRDRDFHGYRNFGPRGHRFYDHGRYYPERGAFFRVLPRGYHSYYWRGRPYFFVGGTWYANGPGGYVVAAPPLGLTVSVLPPFYTTVYLGGVPYYYADDVYYRWNAPANAYEIVEPPAGADAAVDAAAPGAPPPPGAAPGASGEDQLYIYPKNGQSQDQQSKDRYECHSWATNQTGFDPTQPGGGAAAGQNPASGQQYRRAITACLQARGYSVQ